MKLFSKMNSTWVLDANGCGYDEDSVMAVQDAFNELTEAIQKHLTQKVQRLEMEVIALREENKVMQRGLKDKELELHDQSKSLQKQESRIEDLTKTRQSLATDVDTLRKANAQLRQALAQITAERETLKIRYDAADTALTAHLQTKVFTAR